MIDIHWLIAMVNHRHQSQGKVDRVEWPFEASGVEAPAFASGFCRISPELPVIPKNTVVTISVAPDSPGKRPEERNGNNSRW